MYNIGDKVVYPMHGAGIIESIEQKEILGEEKNYYVLRLPLKNMKVMLPVDNVTNLGVRKIIAVESVEDVIEVLGEKISEMPANWNRRYRQNMERVKSGDIFEVAGVVRNLEIMDRQKGLSAGERKMLSNTKQILVSELVLAKDSDETAIIKIVNDSIHV